MNEYEIRIVCQYLLFQVFKDYARVNEWLKTPRKELGGLCGEDFISEEDGTYLIGYIAKNAMGIIKK